MALVKSLHFERPTGQSRNLSESIIAVLSRMSTDLVQPSRADGAKVLTRSQIRNFILFVTHSLRLLIIMQSVDKNCLDSDDNPQ